MKRLTRDKTVPAGQRYKVLEPVMTIDSGETMEVETINHMSPIVWSEDDLHPHGSPEYREREETGPIFVRGAEPGDMLAVRVEKIKVVGLPHAHGRGPLADRYPRGALAFPIDGDRCVLPGGLRVPLSPMIGDIYTTPATPQVRWVDNGGNMDVTDVCPGNTLYLPVYHEGGLLVLGDVHAFQGDGEMYGEGGECAADVTVTVSVDREHISARPVVESPECLMALAGRDTLWNSITVAVEDMTGLLAGLYGWDEADARLYATMLGSLRFGACMAHEERTRNGLLIGLRVPKYFD